jgi:hypothetical protein
VFFVAPSDRGRWQAPGGEEILVLDSVFPDEHGDDPASTWLRQPPGSAFLRNCTRFVTLGVVLPDSPSNKGIHWARSPTLSTEPQP